jgi:hypothetical protein
MLAIESDGNLLRIHYRSYRLGLLLLAIPPALIYELGGSLLGGNLDGGERLGFAIGVLLPIAGAYYLIEFSRFCFSRDERLFRWQWRNLVRRSAGEVPFERIARVGRQAIDASDSSGRQHLYRLVVELDDASVIPLCRGFSGLHDRKLAQISDQVRAHLGHIAVP